MQASDCLNLPDLYNLLVINIPVNTSTNKYTNTFNTLLPLKFKFFLVYLLNYPSVTSINP